jgi:hypothetical protein
VQRWQTVLIGARLPILSQQVHPRLPKNHTTGPIAAGVPASPAGPAAAVDPVRHAS